MAAAEGRDRRYYGRNITLASPAATQRKELPKLHHPEAEDISFSRLLTVRLEWKAIDRENAAYPWPC